MREVDVNKAWDTVYDRLKKDKLLPEEIKTGRSPVPFRRIAAVALICLAGSIFFLIYKPGKETLLSMQNNNMENTLVTTLEDGSTVYLSGNTSIYYPKNFAPDKRSVKIEGSALFDISHEKERPFFVETGQISIEVLGTAFKVQATGKEEAFEISVQRGKVKITNNETNEFVFAMAGEVVRMHSKHLQKQKIDNNRSFSAFTEKMTFKDERLDNILKVIGSVTGKSIVLEDQSVGNKTLTVTFENNMPDSMIELICLALDLTYTQKQDTIYISQL